MADVLDLDGVTIMRGGNALLDDVSWQVSEGERWVVLGANGAGKTTLLQVAAARLHPTRGRATVLGETLGSTDVFDLRPRIGLASAALADRLPAGERVRDVVMTAAYAVAGRWHEQYDELDIGRSDDLLAAFGVEHLRRPHLRHPERGRAQARAAGPLDDDRPGAGAARRAGRRPGPGRPGDAGRATWPSWPLDPLSPVMVLVTHHVEEIPPGFTHVLLMRAGRGGGVRADRRGADRRELDRDLQRSARKWSRSAQRWYAMLRLEGGTSA